MNIAYLANCYPKVSHTFIRREILALEAQGQPIHRFSIRRTEDGLVDEADMQEAERTRVILDVGIVGLVRALVVVALTRPARFARTFVLTTTLGRRSDRGLLRNYAYLAEACVLLGWMRQGAIDHVHAHMGTNPTAVAMLCHALGGPGYSFAAHGPEEFDKPLMLSLREKIERARFVAAVSSYTRSQLYRHCDHAHWSNVHLIRCGLDRDFLEAPAVPVPSQPRLVCVGRLTEQKGQLLLIEAFARVVQAHEAKLILVGDGEMRGEVEALIQARGLLGKVSITGWASNVQVREELEASRCLVLPSLAEGLPVVIMEALALGRPVLTTYIAGIPELVTMDCGYLIPAGSVDALVEAMSSVLDANPAHLTRLGNEGRQRARSMHDAHHEAKALGLLFLRYVGR